MKKICKVCEKEKNISDFATCIERGKIRIRTRCRLCWNVESKERRNRNKEYYNSYCKNYIKNRLKTDEGFRINVNRIKNKNSKKKIAELADGYVNWLLNGQGKIVFKDKTLIAVKRLQLELHRLGNGR